MRREVAIMPWLDRLREDPLPWLLDEAAPAVRHLALRQLLERSGDDPDVVAARAAAMRSDPVAAILASQHPDGWWDKPGPGYARKYIGTVWQLIFLDQLGADPDHPQVQAACEYVLSHSQAESGGFGASGVATALAPPSSYVIHCLTGNLLRALIGFGRLDDARLGRAIDWEAAAITGEGEIRWYKSSVPGPGFRCAANDGQPCAWGAVKAVLGLARIPPGRRSPHIQRALDAGVAFLLSRDPAVADYPVGYGDAKPSGSWFRLGFPSGYVADVLQVLEALCDAGVAGDPRLGPAVDWLLARQDERGRWANRYAYAGKMVVDIDRPGEPSRWVTLRACRVLMAVAAASATASAAAPVASAAAPAARTAAPVASAPAARV